MLTFNVIFAMQAGSRNVLVDVVPTVWGNILTLMKSNTASQNPLLRKFLVKLTQRVGLVCLPHRLPTWRYVVRIRKKNCIITFILRVELLVNRPYSDKSIEFLCGFEDLDLIFSFV